MAKSKGKSKNSSKSSTNKNVSRAKRDAALKRQRRIEIQIRTEKIRKRAQQRRKDFEASRQYRSFVQAPDFRAVEPYTPKRGGLADRASAKGPRKSTDNMLRQKAVQRPKQKQSGNISPAKLAAINESRSKTRSSLDPRKLCVKKPDSQKAAKIRQQPKKAGSGSKYGFRKWC